MNKNHLKILYQLQKFKKAIPEMVTVMGVESNKHFVKSFIEQGFIDSSLEKWKPRKRTTYRTKRGRIVDDTTRGILIGRGTAILRKSIKVRKYGKNAVINYSNLPYAKVHNDGLRAGRGKGFKMPKRQFVGYSKVMNKRIIEKINKVIRRVYE